MKYTLTQQQFKQHFLSFVMQRIRVYQSIHPDPALLARAQQLKTDLLSIEHMGYWRFCHELMRKAAQVMKILPSPYGGHQQIRTRICQMLEQARAVAIIPAHIWKAESLNTIN